jgi:hypothetical protein
MYKKRLTLKRFGNAESKFQFFNANIYEHQNSIFKFSLWNQQSTGAIF